jgi:hypothetical protein
MDFISLVVPIAESSFVSHPAQNALMARAIKQGLILRVYGLVHAKIEWTVREKSSGLVVLRDVREVFEVALESPHLVSEQDVVALDEATGAFGLGFQWRVCDIDGILEGGEDVRKEVWKRQSVKIDWNSF